MKRPEAASYNVIGEGACCWLTEYSRRGIGSICGVCGQAIQSSFTRILRWKRCAASVRVVSKRVLRVRASRTKERCLSGATSARRLLMPARETEAIILKTFPLGEADRLVSFLGRTSGRIRGVAGGARRLKNRYGSTLEVLSHVQLWYVEKETRDLVRIQQCELLESFHRSQSDYGLSTGLALISEIAERVLPEHETAEPMFRLILLTAREVERRGSSALPLSYFTFWTVRLAGWLPRFDICAVCGKPFEKGAAYQSTHFQGLLDEQHRQGGMKLMTYETRALAEIFAKQRLDALDDRLARLPGVKELREASLGWIEHHAERKLTTRALLET